MHCLRALDDCNFLLINPEAKTQLDKETPIDYKMLRITMFVVDLLSKEVGNTIVGEKVLSVMRLISDAEQPGKWAGDRKGKSSI